MVDKDGNTVIETDGDFWIISPLEISPADIITQFIKKNWADDFNVMFYDRTSKANMIIVSPLKDIGIHLNRIIKEVLDRENAVTSAVGQNKSKKCFVITTKFKNNAYIVPSCYKWDGLRLINVSEDDTKQTDAPVKVKPIKIKRKVQKPLTHKSVKNSKIVPMQLNIKADITITVERKR